MARSKTPDFARLDDFDIYVQSTPLTEEEHKRLSEIIKANREKYARSRTLRSNVKTPKRSKATSR
ncbi:MAG TPA: hypothetical protein VFD13_01470 [Candidatus Kapabacteria bacterium]|nr:hypothetical protein [Candidatus Kapabacteria bacterium]